MRVLRPALVSLLVLWSAGCATTAELFAADPAMAPGKTTWAAVSGSWRRAQEARSGNSDAGKLESLADLVDRALDHNPAVRAAHAAWRGRIEAVEPAGTPPRPMLVYTYLPLPVETRVGPNEHRVGLQQNIPSPLKLAAEHDRAVAGADAGRFAYERRVLEVLAQLKAHVAEVRYLQRAAEVVAVSEDLARQLATAAAGRAEDDRGTLFDVSKARAQLAQLEYDRLRFEELLAAASARLNALLDRSPQARLPTMPEWPLAPAPESEEALYQLALEQQPRLKAIDADIRAGVAAVEAARGRYWPDMTLSVQLMVNGPAGMAGVRDSGREALGVTIGLSLPLWFGADDARVESAKAEVRRRVHEKRAHVGELLADVKDAVLRLRNARRLMQLYDRSLLPQARKAMADADAWQRSGVAGFTDFLEARATLYRFSLARERAAADALQAEARLELLVGGPWRAQEGGS